MSADRITAVYLIETPLDPAQAAEALAGEQQLVDPSQHLVGLGDLPG